MAEKLRRGILEKRIFKAPRRFSVLRELSRIHITATHDLVRAQSRTKSLYRSRGIFVPGGSVYSTRHRQQWQERLPLSVQTTATRRYGNFDFLAEQKKQAERDLVRESRRHPIVRILETAPGLGAIRSARLVPIVVTPDRFRTKRQFWSYCGLGIVMRSSSDCVQKPDGGWIRAPIQQTRGLSCQYNHVLKDIFKGAATTVMAQRNKDPIYADYRRMLDSRIKPRLAKLTLARKIAATVLRMWKDEEAYQPEKVRRPRDTDREA